MDISIPVRWALLPCGMLSLSLLRGTLSLSRSKGLEATIACSRGGHGRHSRRARGPTGSWADWGRRSRVARGVPPHRGEDEAASTPVAA